MCLQNNTFRCGTAELDSSVPTENPVWEDGHLKVTCTGCNCGCRLNGYGLISETKYLELFAQVNK